MVLRASRWRFVLAGVLVGVGLIGAAPVIAGGMSAGNQSSLTAARYSIVVDGIEIAAFNHLVVMTRDMNQRPTVELRRGLTGGLEIDAWFQAAEEHPSAGRKDFTLIMYSADGMPVARYRFTKGFPTSIRVTGTGAGGPQALVQDVTFTGERVQRLAPQ